MRFLTSIVVTFACFTIAPGPRAHAQTGETPQDTTHLRTARMFWGATAGTGLGMLGGIHFGESLGWGGGDDPGLIGALLFGAIGSVAGNAAGAKVFEPRLSLNQAVMSGFLGAAGGLFVIAGVSKLILDKIDAAPAAAVIGFSVASGGLAALVSRASQR